MVLGTKKNFAHCLLQSTVAFNWVVCAREGFLQEKKPPLVQNAIGGGKHGWRTTQLERNPIRTQDFLTLFIGIERHHIWRGN